MHGLLQAKCKGRRSSCYSRIRIGREPTDLNVGYLPKPRSLLNLRPSGHPISTIFVYDDAAQFELLLFKGPC